MSLTLIWPFNVIQCQILSRKLKGHNDLLCTHFIQTFIIRCIVSEIVAEIDHKGGVCPPGYFCRKGALRVILEASKSHTGIYLIEKWYFISIFFVKLLFKSVLLPCNIDHSTIWRTHTHIYTCQTCTCRCFTIRLEQQPVSQCNNDTGVKLKTHTLFIIHSHCPSRKTIFEQCYLLTNVLPTVLINWNITPNKWDNPSLKHNKCFN